MRNEVIRNKGKARYDWKKGVTKEILVSLLQMAPAVVIVETSGFNKDNEKVLL